MPIYILPIQARLCTQYVVDPARLCTQYVVDPARLCTQYVVDPARLVYPVCGWPKAFYATELVGLNYRD